jgi:CRISPR-associated endonuclease/helicase Cas3
MKKFEQFFYTACGFVPHRYQQRLAEEGLPAAVEAPTGTGKTGIILAWLWRRLSEEFGDSTPRRLVYALPQRSLVEQVASEAGKWLANLDLSKDVALHVVMGGLADAKESQWQWRTDMHKPAIVVGTVDSLVSKALNRGYGIARATYPVDFALVTSGAHWVIDEVQLCPESTTTLRQIAAFAQAFGTAEPFGLTCMSATIPAGLLETVDNPTLGERVHILPEERVGELAVRLNAARTIRRLDADSGDYKAVAARALNLHRTGTLTLVVLNTVDAAQNVFKHLKSRHGKCTLLHSRFRGVERGKLMNEVTEDPDDRIVVSTQVVEAGVDLNASALISEAAPWPSMVQRAGRCNRTGRIDGAELWWIPPKTPHPYELADIDETVAELLKLEGEPVTGEDLLNRSLRGPDVQVSVLRKSDFTELFDTSPDLSGADIDVAPYVRDAEDLDAQVAWATWTPEPNTGAPSAEAKAPAAMYRCRVPLQKVKDLASEVPVWRMDQVLGKWTRVSQQARARPGEVLVVNAADGRYDPAIGFDPTAKESVPDSPVLLTKAELEAGAEDPYRGDSSNVEQRSWMLLDEHSRQVRDQAISLLDTIRAILPDGAARAAIQAAHLHDVGKAHEIWQTAICNLAPSEDERAEKQSTGPWAKSKEKGRLVFDGGIAFRHELASLLMLEGPLSDLLDDVEDPDLVRYLVLAHHGKLRLQVRDPGDLAVIAENEAFERKILGLEQGTTAAIPPILGRPAASMTVDLGQFEFGGDRSWTRTALALRDRYGPFVLAYLEAIVRVADWRASKGLAVTE